MTHREVPAGVKQITPVQAAYNFIREQNAVLENERAKSQSAQKKAEKTVREVVFALNNFRRNQNEWTESTKRAFQTIDNALQKNGIEIIDYTGQTLTDELLDMLKVEGWEPSDLAEDTVKETFTPEIRWNGNLLQLAQVFCFSAKEKETDEEVEKIEEVNEVEMTGKPEETEKIIEAAGQESDVREEQPELSDDSVPEEPVGSEDNKTTENTEISEAPVSFLRRIIEKIKKNLKIK